MDKSSDLNNNGLYPGLQVIDGNYNTFAHTNIEESPWLQLDLVEPTSMRSVEVVNRCEVQGLHLFNFAIDERILTLEHSRYTVISYILALESEVCAGLNFVSKHLIRPPIPLFCSVPATPRSYFCVQDCPERKANVLHV